MDFREYQNKASTTAEYPGRFQITGLFYAGLGLSGEAGEVAEQIKKTWRDDTEVTHERKQAIFSELGDTLWYLSQVAAEIGVNLNDVAEFNIAKLESRKARGVISGSGSDR